MDLFKSLNLKKYKIILYLFFVVSNLISEEVGVIYSPDYPESTEINLGPVYIGDSLDFQIKYKNFSDTTYYIYGVKPTFGIFRYPFETIPDEFLSYRHLSPVFPIKVLPKSDSEIKLQFRADTNLTVYPLGWYNADIILGFGLPPDTTIALQKKFHYFTKKTNKFIDGYQDVMQFDSIFVNPPIPFKNNWKVRSTYSDNTQITKQELKLLTPKVTIDEFLPTFFEINPIFPKKRDVIEWEIGYSPRNKGTDSAEFRLYYNASEGKEDYCKVLLVGTGVEQKLNLINSNYAFSNDTIFLGSIPTNTIIPLEFELYNSGNFPFNSLGDTMVASSIVPFEYEIPEPFNFDKNYLKPNNSRKIKANISLKERGIFVLRYIINSDAVERFKFAPKSSKEIVFYIVGKATQPEIQVNNTTIDFENVYLYYPYCRSSKDTTILIRNIGNDTLRINKIEISNQQPMFAFSANETELIVPPNDFGRINLKFEPVLPQLFTANLILHNNSNNPNFTLELKGIASTPAIARLEIDSHRVRPGTLLVVPIKTNQNIAFANEFSDTLYYDRSILHYVGYEFNGTAVSQPIELISLQESIDGKLAIHIRKPKKTNFAADTILIKLKFNTFLGNSSSTNISFNSPKLGNEHCERTLNITPDNVINGKVVIDSICAIDLKAFPRKLKINSFFTNSNQRLININYELSASGVVQYEIYDCIGRLVFARQQYQIAQMYDRSIDLPELPTGFYIMKVTFLDEMEIRKFYWFGI